MSKSPGCQGCGWLVVTLNGAKPRHWYCVACDPSGEREQRHNYSRYIEANWHRRPEGFEPISYAEFLTSEEGTITWNSTEG